MPPAVERKATQRDLDLKLERLPSQLKRLRDELDAQTAESRTRACTESQAHLRHFQAVASGDADLARKTRASLMKLQGREPGGTLSDVADVIAKFQQRNARERQDVEQSIEALVSLQCEPSEAALREQMEQEHDLATRTCVVSVKRRTEEFRRSGKRWVWTKGPGPDSCASVTVGTLADDDGLLWGYTLSRVPTAKQDPATGAVCEREDRQYGRDGPDGLFLSRSLFLGCDYIEFETYTFQGTPFYSRGTPLP